MPSHSFSFSLDEEAKITREDATQGTIRQVSLISLGQAKGHETEEGKQIWVDGKTLSQIFDCLTVMGRLKLKIDHGSGVMSTAGWFDGFEKTGSKILADMHVYESEPERRRMFEIAQKNPDHLGLSLEFSGDDEILGDKAFARCDEVLAGALVSEPAANASLFEKANKSVDKKPHFNDKATMEKKTKLDATGGSDGAELDATPDRSKMFDDFCKKYADDTAMLKKFDDFLTNTDGRPAPSGPDKAIDPNVVPVVTNDEDSEDFPENKIKLSDDEKDEDETDDDKKDDKVNTSALEARIEQKLLKRFAASLGTTRIPAPGVGDGITKGKAEVKTFEAIVAETAAKEFKGDRNKAMLHCLEAVRKSDPDMVKLYGAARSKFLKVEPKVNRYL